MAEKKQVPLRISKELFDELSRWAEDDFRSLNGQIEYLLTDCVRKRRKKEFSQNNGEKEQNSLSLYFILHSLHSLHHSI